MSVFIFLLFLGFVVLFILSIKGNIDIAKKETAKQKAMPPHELQVYLESQKTKADIIKKEAAARKKLRSEEWEYGPVNSVMVCPHCNCKGSIRTKEVETKNGVSGGKATAALLTGGVSLLAVGLSRKGQSTQAWCGSCRNRWSF